MKKEKRSIQTYGNYTKVSYRGPACLLNVIAGLLRDRWCLCVCAKAKGAQNHYLFIYL